MVRLDGYGRAVDRDRFDDVGIDGSLAEPFDGLVLGFEPEGLPFKDLDKHPADDLALFLRMGDACQFPVKMFPGIDTDDVKSEAFIGA